MRSAPHTTLVFLALIGAPALAQPQPGIYGVVGNDQALGPYTGQVELRDQGTHLDYVRLVRFQNQTTTGQQLATAWTGRATRQGNTLQLAVRLDRIGWITEANGLQRTPADRVPDQVTGTYRPDPAGGLAGVLTSPNGVAANEALTRTGPVHTAPLFAPERTTIPIHRPLPGWMRTVLFTVFNTYHRLPHVQPFVPRADFQTAIHMELRDRTGFGWLRANPGTLLLHNKRVDAISLAEAELRHGAYGLRLHEKAARYDRDAEGRHLDQGLLAWAVRPNPSAPGGLEKIEDMSTFEWSAAYLFGQRCRYLATRDPQALANIVNMIGVFCDMIEIDPRPGEFARSLRPVGRRPNVGSWHAGQGRFAHLAYHDNGNNDMIKGFWVAFFAAWDVLPANHPLRPRIVACVREVADDWVSSNPTAAGGSGHNRDRPKNIMMNAMLAYWITRDPRYEQQYRAQLRKPKLLLELALGGYVAAYGFGDWSGTHLGVLSDIARVELGRKLGSRWSLLYEHSLKMNWRWLHKYRTTAYSVAAAAYLNTPGAADEALWQLREFPYPKPHHGVERVLDPTASLSPFPEKPWKMDWLLGQRDKSLYTYPVFMRSANNYVYRSTAFDKGGPATTDEHPGGDYLFAYWMARHYGVVPPNE